MSDTILAAAIAAGGAVAVAVASALTQVRITRSVIQSERERTATQIRSEAVVRAQEKKADRLIDAISNLVAHADPDIHEPIDYQQVVILIRKAQLLLDRSNPAESQLNHALNAIGQAAERYLLIPSDERRRDPGLRRELFATQSAVIESTRALLNSPIPQLPA